MIAVTFQSTSVLACLTENKIYFADSCRARERREYLEDIKQVGKQPVWLFANPNRQSLRAEDFEDGTMLERFRCEMSLDQRKGLSSFVMLEIEKPEDAVFVGKTHNACDYAYVTSCIKPEELRAVYKICPTNHWYFKAVVPVALHRQDALFTHETICACEEHKIALGLTTQLNCDLRPLTL